MEPEKFDPGFYPTIQTIAPNMPKPVMAQIFKEMFRMKMRKVMEINGGVYPWNRDE